MFLLAEIRVSFEISSGLSQGIKSERQQPKRFGELKPHLRKNAGFVYTEHRQTGVNSTHSAHSTDKQE